MPSQSGMWLTRMGSGPRAPTSRRRSDRSFSNTESNSRHVCQPLLYPDSSFNFRLSLFLIVFCTNIC
uniref:Uncharacterized protein n=1 Tax=Timema douglasi TaxID=61478 RepID=A0A7R8VVD6_TIMDO|nr:unnamed protein product [Timema douglasi]